MKNRFVKMQDEDYFKRPELSNSDLGLIKQSLSKYLNKKNKSTPSLDFGKAYHRLILEPSDFDKYVKVWIKSEGTLKALQASLQPEEIVIKEDEYDTLLRMRDVLYKHPEASKLLKGEKELAGFFQYNDIDCRMKIDIINHEDLRIVDLKTTGEDLSDIHNLLNTIIKYGYYRQEAFYEIGTYNILKQPYTATFIIQEKSEPYDLRLFELSTEFFELAKIEIDKLILKYKKYQENKEQFTGYAADVLLLEPPLWLENSIMEL